MRLLDLFCKAGGCSVGYSNAGFEVVGVDIEPQKNYPFEFHQVDWYEYLIAHWQEFDVIHASPPCQVYSVTSALSNGNRPDLVGDVQKALRATGKPYVIENVPGSPLDNPITLCGTMFPELRVIRHRLFETFPVLWWPPGKCNHWGRCAPIYWGDLIKVGYKPGISKSAFEFFDFISVCGNSYLAVDGRRAMGIDWMTRKELSQSIPPAYTKWIGSQLLATITQNPAGISAGFCQGV